MLAGPLPDQATRLLEKRNKAVEKIDAGLNRELEKQKIGLTKRREIDAAVAVADLIEAGKLNGNARSLQRMK